MSAWIFSPLSDLRSCFFWMDFEVIHLACFVAKKKGIGVSMVSSIGPILGKIVWDKWPYVGRLGGAYLDGFVPVVSTEMEGRVEWVSFVCRLKFTGSPPNPCPIPHRVWQSSGCCRPYKPATLTPVPGV